jgi:hypothetical protein
LIGLHFATDGLDIQNFLYCWMTKNVVTATNSDELESKSFGQVLKARKRDVLMLACQKTRK